MPYNEYAWNRRIGHRAAEDIASLPEASLLHELQKRVYEQIQGTEFSVGGVTPRLTQKSVPQRSMIQD